MKSLWGAAPDEKMERCSWVPFFLVPFIGLLTEWVLFMRLQTHSPVKLESSQLWLLFQSWVWWRKKQQHRSHKKHWNAFSSSHILSLTLTEMGRKIGLEWEEFLCEWKIFLPQNRPSQAESCKETPLDYIFLHPRKSAEAPFKGWRR